MLSRGNLYTLTSFCKYREYKRHVELKNSIVRLLSQCFEFVDSEFYCFTVGFENQEALEFINRGSLQNTMSTVYPTFTYNMIGQTDCISSNGNTQKISIQQSAYECYHNYTQLLNFICEYLTFLRQDEKLMLFLYYNTEQKKAILKQILTVIQKYLKFDCRQYGVLNEVSSILHSLKTKVQEVLIEISNGLFNDEKKKFLQFSAKINNYFKIHHERIKRSCGLIHEIEEEITLNFSNFFLNIEENEIFKKLCYTEKEEQTPKEETLPLLKIQNQESKRALADLLQQYIDEKIKATYKCLNCQRSFEHCKLLKHVNLCQKKYEYDQLLQENLTEILPRLLDLNGVIPILQNLYKQKIKAKKLKHPQPSPINQKKSKFYNKKLSRTTTQFPNKRNQFLDIGSDLDDDAPQNTSSKLNPIKKVHELNETELKDLIKIIQKISGIGEDIKMGRQSLNFLIYYKLRELKNSISRSYKNLNVQCPEAETMINLLLARYNYLQSAKKNSIKAKRSGINTDDEYLSLENVEIQGRYTQPQRQQKIHKKNGFQTPYASQDEASSISSQMFEEKHTGVRQFQIIKRLGKGSFATVYYVRKKATQQKYAMKKIRIENYHEYYESSVLSENLENQQCVFSITDNPFVMKAFFSFTEDQYHYFVMEYCPNGDLQDIIKKEKRLTEDQAKLYLAEIVEGVDYLHKKFIIHRDLKPQNIMIDVNWHLKLTDYGLSDAGIKNKKNSFEKVSKNLSKFAQSSRKVKIAIEQKKRGVIGSPYYIAPEVFRGEPATIMSDWWSFGVIFFQILVGIPPFLGRTRREIQESILKHKIWPSEIIFGHGEDQISLQAKDLIDKLLVLDPKKRIGHDVNDIKSHQFFKGIDWDHLLQMNPPDLDCRYTNDKSDDEEVQEEDPENNKNEKQKQIQHSQEKNSFRESQSGSNKSFSRELLVRRDLLNNTTLIKYKAREQLLQKVRTFTKRLREQCQTQQPIE